MCIRDREESKPTSLLANLNSKLFRFFNSKIMFKSKFEILGFEPIPVDGLKGGSGNGLWHFLRTRKSIVKFCPLGNMNIFSSIYFLSYYF